MAQVRTKRFHLTFGRGAGRLADDREELFQRGARREHLFSLPGVTASSLRPSPPEEEREIRSAVGGSVKMHPAGGAERKSLDK